MGGLTPNFDSVEPMFMMPEVKPKRSKRLRLQIKEVDEEQSSLQMIQELVNEKMYFFSHQNHDNDDDDDDDDDQDFEVVVKEPKKTKKPMKKRQRSPTDDDDNEEEKNNKKQKIEFFSDDHEEVSVVNDVKTTKKPATNKCRPPIEDEEYKEEQKTVKKKKVQNYKKTNVRSAAISNETTERLKEFITGEMKGSELKLVIQKLLYATDLAKGQNRLSMPINQLETTGDEFLREDEKQLLDRDTAGFDVPLLGPTLQLFTKPMKLGKWNLKTTSNYILKTNWNQFVDENNKYLKVNTKVQVWSFRREEDQQLCFAIVCVGRAGDENDDA